MLEQPVDGHVGERGHDLLERLLEDTFHVERTEPAEERRELARASLQRRDRGLRIDTLEGGHDRRELSALGALLRGERHTDDRPVG